MLCGEETFLLRLDWAKATAEHGRTEPVELEGYPEDSTKGGRPKKHKTTKAPPVTQEGDGFGHLASEEEEFDEDDVDDEELGANGIAARNAAMRESIPARPRGARRNGGADDRTDGGCPKNSFPRRGDDLDGNYDEELDAASNKATHESILARTRRAKSDGDANDRPHRARRDGGVDDRTGGGRLKNSFPRTGDDLDDNDNEELDAARDEATLESISACTHGDKRDGDANEWTNGGHPKIALLKTTGNLAYNDEELNDGGTEYEEDLKDDGRTALTVWAEPPPKCQRRCLARRRCLVLPPAAKTRGKPDRAEALPIFSREQQAWSRTKTRPLSSGWSRPTTRPCEP